MNILDYSDGIDEACHDSSNSESDKTIQIIQQE